MNNKGQTLVIFVIVLPILLIMLTLIVDLGFLYIEKRNIDNNVYSSLKYYLENINDNDIKGKVRKLLNKNIKELDINIDETNEYVEISVSKKHKSLYSIITHNTTIDISYKGMKESKRIIKG